MKVAEMAKYNFDNEEVVLEESDKESSSSVDEDEESLRRLEFMPKINHTSTFNRATQNEEARMKIDWGG